jgi:glycosyltransferase involved in cell wall biosynthesis
MRIAYANANYRPNRPSGGNAHVRQFVDNLVKLGHEVWTWPNNQHPQTQQIPPERFQRWTTLRKMDAVCTRIEDKLPAPGFIRWSSQPYKRLIGSPVTVWEFNTVPEFGLLQGHSEAQVQQEIDKLRQYGQHCDVAVCVSNALADYVRTHLNIQNVLIVPNGSDPDLFHPDVTPVQRVLRQPDCLNVVWIGSADLAWHNFDLLRDTAQILLHSQDEGAQQINFHIIGNAHALMREMPSNVQYHGSENYEYLPHWLAAMDVGLCLYRPGSADYSSPLKVFDYMSSGLTVVGVSHPQLKEIFQQLDQSDLMIPSADPKALAQTLISLAVEPDRVKYQGKKSRQLVIDFYNWSRAVKDTVNAIEAIQKTK